MKVRKLVATMSVLFGIALLALNFYGEWSTMRVAELIPESTLKFTDDVSIGYDEALVQIEKNKLETDLQFAIRINTVVQKSLAHIEDWETQQPDLYSQRVPVKENIWLNLIGRFSTEPQLQRYHFSDYKRTLQRGIGICGDTSITLSDILWKNNIPNSIRSYDGHVVVEVRAKGEDSHILDADYGVHFNNRSENTAENALLIESEYARVGYSESVSQNTARILTGSYTSFSDTYDFMTKRYILERITYVFKWLAPIMLISFGWILLRSFRHSHSNLHYKAVFGSNR